MTRALVALHFGLVQDVAVLRPVARLAAAMPTIDVGFLVSHNFASRDANGRWMAEIDKLATELGITPLIYESAFDVLEYFGPRHGMIVAGSESGVAAHVDAHDLFKAMPGRVRTITLQHGLECVGFLHNARHDATSGRNVRFAADIAVGWFELDRMSSVTAAERSKMVVAGPSIMIDPPTRTSRISANAPGMICENLHSVRFVNGQMREDFLRTFTSFAERLAAVGQSLVLRAHPAGRFTERNAIILPPNVTVSMEPIYDIEPRDFAYVISAPSTILLDFVPAGVPVATWVDVDGTVDASNFAGLSTVASLDDWWRFNWAARWERDALVAQQDRYRDSLGMPSDVRERYQSLLAVA